MTLLHTLDSCLQENPEYFMDGQIPPMGVIHQRFVHTRIELKPKVDEIVDASRKYLRARLWRRIIHNASLAALESPGRNIATLGARKASDLFEQHIFPIMWVEAVEDIVAVKKRLMSLASTGTDDYRVWDSTRQKFIDPLDDCA
jgi:hypothetical protein